MAKKAKFDFNRFTDFYGSIDLYTHTLRQAWQCDALDGVDEFEAVVLTEPIPANLSFLSNFFGLPAGSDSLLSDDQQEKYIFQARIISNLSPHQFLTNPCDINTVTTIEEQNNIQDGIQLHTTVFGYSLKMRPVQGDYVKIKLMPGEFTYDLKNAILVEKITNLSPQAKSVIDNKKKKATAPMPASSATAFKKYEGGTVLHPDTKQYKATYDGMEVLNGRIPVEMLVSPSPELYRASFTAKFLPEVLPSFENLARDYKAHFGEPIWLSDSYRDYAGQVKQRGSGFGARPGSSNHGWAVAFDVNGTNVDVDKDGKRGTKYDRFNSKVYKWLDNGGAGRYGWVNPPSLRENGRLPEAWHWENTTIRDQVLKNRTIIPNYAIPDGEEKAPMS